MRTPSSPLHKMQVTYPSALPINGSAETTIAVRLVDHKSLMVHSLNPEIPESRSTNLVRHPWTRARAVLLEGLDIGMAQRSQRWICEEILPRLPVWGMTTGAFPIRKIAFAPLAGVFFVLRPRAAYRQILCAAMNILTARQCNTKIRPVVIVDGLVDERLRTYYDMFSGTDVDEVVLWVPPRRGWNRLLQRVKRSLTVAGKSVTIFRGEVVYPRISETDSIQDDLGEEEEETYFEEPEGDDLTQCDVSERDRVTHVAYPENSEFEE